MRDYGTEGVIWEGDLGIPCEDHKWDSEIISPGSRVKDPGDKKNIPKGTREDFQKSNFCIDKFCNAWKGSLGLEPTPQLFVQHLVQIFEAIKPKLADHGSIWVNLGDTYAGGGNANGHTGLSENAGRMTLAMGATISPPQQKLKSVGKKSLVGIPDRFKIAMIDAGWICRNEIIWHKASVLPTSAKDRFTVDFEKFYFFTKKPDYYFKQQLEPMKTQSIARMKRGVGDNHKYSDMGNASGLDAQKRNYGQKPHTLHKPRKLAKGQHKNKHSGIHNEDGSIRANTELGVPMRNMRTKWTIEGANETYQQFILERKDEFNKWLSSIETDPLSIWVVNPKGFKEKHFATFPEKLIETPIKASCPELVCTECGKPQVIIIENKGGAIGKGWHDHSSDEEQGMHQVSGSISGRVGDDGEFRREIKGWSKCDCNAPFRKGMVFDPFMGSGTTAVVASNLNRNWLGCELSAEYIEIAKKRIYDNTSEHLDEYFPYD